MRTDEKQGQSYVLTGQKAIFPKLFQLDKCVKGSLLKLIKLKHKTQIWALQSLSTEEIDQL